MIEIITPASYDSAFRAYVLDHLKIEDSSLGDLYEDPGDSALHPLVSHYIAAAIGRVEACCGRMLFKRSLRLTADSFVPALVLPASPVIEVTKVEYVDAEGATQTLDSAAYALVDRMDTPQLVPAYGASWPVTRAFPGAAIVEFEAGYGDDMDSIPAPLLQAVAMTCADWFRFAGNVATVALHELPDNAYQACQPFRREWA